MKRLRLFILLFCIALSVPLGYFILRTYRSLEQEEISRLRFFAETIFNEMERELAELVAREEDRPVDAYNYRYVPEGDDPSAGTRIRSPLSRPPPERFIIGYFQNNPDGSFGTPLVEDPEGPPPDRAELVSRLREANAVFNTRRTVVSEPPAHASSMEFKAVREERSKISESAEGFADKFLARDRRKREYLGKEAKRVEEITVSQARNMAQMEAAGAEPDGWADPAPPDSSPEGLAARTPAARSVPNPFLKGKDDNETYRQTAEPEAQALSPVQGPTLRAEVDPLQSVFITDERIFIFRRILLGNRIYRQGFLLDSEGFLDHLTARHFSGQPMSRFTGLRLVVADRDRPAAAVTAGIPIGSPRFVVDRTFPRPFSFLKATLVCETVPPVAGRRTLTVMIAGLVLVILLGFFSIHQSARVVLDHSRRRSRFVSSVTHELKTPLTNIRMYIEMLEQGIAPSPDREREYYRILDAETARLSRLINNVLEFSKLEKKQFRLSRKEGDFSEVVSAVAGIMSEKLRKEGFALETDHRVDRPFLYDPEVMIQVLINLMENSMKFGKKSPEKRITLRVAEEGRWIRVSLSDTGPGIPRHALKRVFDDFFRVDDPLVRTTRGTGIGLAFVKKVVALTGGSVQAGNNEGPGCTIAIRLPAGPEPRKA